MKDDALEEIWAIRRKIWDECDRDLAKLYEFYRQGEMQHVRSGGKLITKPGPRVPDASKSAIIREDTPA